MSLNWSQLRSFNGTQHAAFEHLCAALAHREPTPAGSVWTRNGRPDGGVECYWTTPGGELWAWQAKFFLDALGDGQWTQLDESVATALEKYPKLHKLFVCLPRDLPDARLPRQRSARQRWDDRVKKWKAWARARGLSTEFSLWDEFQLTTRLEKPELAGTATFWFDATRRGLDWFMGWCDVAIRDAGPRYTPDAHVEVDAANALFALGADPPFREELDRLRESILDAWATLEDHLEEDAVKRMASHVDRVAHHLRHPRGRPEATFDTAALAALAKEIEREFDVDRAACGALPAGEDRDRRERARRELRSALGDLEDYLGGPAAAAARSRNLLITGEAGSGKTHLFCDVARQRLAMGAPSLLVLGHQFAGDLDPLVQLAQMLGFGGDGDRLLDTLDAAAEAYGRRAVLMIDALNEGRGPQLWPGRLAGTVHRVLLRPNLALALSVRDPYQRTVVPEHLSRDVLPRLKHTGFAGVEYEALRAFCTYYDVRLPSVAPLDPEFRNPLFLKTYCEAIRHHGLHDVPAGIEGITALRHFYVNGLHEKLCRGDQLDYGPERNLVARAAAAVADAMVAAEASEVPFEDAHDLVEALLPGRPHSRSLFASLLSAGLLVKSVRWQPPRTAGIDGAADAGAGQQAEADRGRWVDVVRFNYERLTDHLLIERLLDPDATSDRVARALRFVERQWNPGTLLEALSIQLAERTGSELLGLKLPDSLAEYAGAATIAGISWRKPSAVGSALHELLKRATEERPGLLDLHFAVLLTCVARPEHFYNAERLDAVLRQSKTGERDVWWNWQIDRHFGRGGPVDAVIDWALSPSDKSPVGDESLFLAAVMLAWCCTTPNRRLRDRATKAIVALLRDRPGVVLRLVDRFEDVDDPYVAERVYAAAYGAAMLTRGDTEGLGALAVRVYELIFQGGDPPARLLLRDYARGVCELALHHRWPGSDRIDAQAIRPPYKSEWPSSLPTRAELEPFFRHDKAPDPLRSVWYSVTTGDFARYTIGTNSGRSEWNAERIGTTPAPEPLLTPKKRYRVFLDSLTPDEAVALASYLEKTEGGERWSFSEMTGEGRVATEELLEAIALERRRECEEFVLPFLGGNHHLLGRRREATPFNLDLIIRFILDRVRGVDVDWEHAGRIGNRYDHSASRMEHANERLGKKYQWIAYDEAVARIADNFAWHLDEYSFPPDDRYRGPWQIHARDIDPSALPVWHRRTNGASPHWWLPQGVIPDPEITDDLEWVRADGPFGDPRRFLMSTDPGGRRWYCLSGIAKVDKYPSREERRRRVRWRSADLVINAALVASRDAEAIRRWLDGLEWGSRPTFLLDEPSESTFLGEHAWAPAYFRVDGVDPAREGWRSSSAREGPPRRMLPLSCYYGLSQGEYDKSLPDGDRSTVVAEHFHFPCGWLTREMKLRWAGGSRFTRDGDERVVVQDPSEGAIGPGALLIDADAFDAFLAERKLEVVWALRGERRAFHESDTRFLGHVLACNGFRRRAGNWVGELTPAFTDRPS